MLGKAQDQVQQDKKMEELKNDGKDGIMEMEIRKAVETRTKPGITPPLNQLKDLNTNSVRERILKFTTMFNVPPIIPPKPPMKTNRSPPKTLKPDSSEPATTSTNQRRPSQKAMGDMGISCIGEGKPRPKEGK